jgi:hypothetical protein
MATSKTTVEPLGSSWPIRSGIVTAIRYQLKQTRPSASRNRVSSGASTRQPESS